MTSIQKLLSLWNRIVVRDSNEFYRTDIILADELIQALRQETSLHSGPELKAATKFFQNTIHQQMVAVGREFQEVHYAYMCLIDPACNGQEAYKNELAEELVDLQTACQTLLVILGVDIIKVRHDVIEKNARRGYYDRS